MFIEVLIEIKNKSLDKTFTYHVKDSQEKDIAIGKRVLVPFGSKTLEGYILNIIDSSLIEAKDICEVLDEEPVLNKEMLEIGLFLKEITLSSLSSCYTAMLPKALKAKKGSTVNKKMEAYYHLKEDYDISILKCKNELQKKILEKIKQETRISKKEASQISASALKTLMKKEILEEKMEEVYRYNLQNKIEYQKKVLTKEQEKAYQKLKKTFHQNKVSLLYGITGSGKTEIYLKLIEEALKEGKTALMLVPEISLTSQLVRRFFEVFKDSVGVLHSSLSDGERYDEWRKIINGKVSIVVGTRSAVFAPLENLGIIILDEEQSESYKQESTPRYHALDVAKKRGEINKCPVILGSATPSFSSMARALKGVYEYVPLIKRANGSMLPTCTIIDMKEEVAKRHPIISRELECKIIEKIHKKEQIMLLLNRRGYSTTITCSNCGYTYRCPNCDITLTYHKKSEHLRCHYCGYTKINKDNCPNCKNNSLTYLGLGTEKLEAYLEEIFPTARIVRMDRDTTTKKGMHEKIVNDFLEHKYDIMLGTQMISKGLDFGNVSLVGILNADTSLNIPDYKSNEKTFELLYQASGRAGRKNTTGEVIIQTFNKEHPLFQFIKENNYPKFYQYEMKLRKTLKYPPFYYLVSLTVKSKNYESCLHSAKKAKSFLETRLNHKNIILGPTTANQFLVNKVYHFTILIKYKFDDALIETLKDLDQMFLIEKGVELEIDFSS